MKLRGARAIQRPQQTPQVQLLMLQWKLQGRQLTLPSLLARGWRLRGSDMAALS
jgi:hypothetical protein